MVQVNGTGGRQLPVAEYQWRELACSGLRRAGRISSDRESLGEANRGFRENGTTQMNRVPRPVSDSKSIDPPWSLMIP